MIVKIVTLHPLHRQEIALKFSELLKDADFIPERIGKDKPLTQAYSQQAFLQLWTAEEKGYENIEIDHMMGTAGGMLGETSDPDFLFTIDWMDQPHQASLNYITFFLPTEAFHGHRDAIMKLFKETILLVNGIYGYMTDDMPSERQHTLGTLETRLPGVYWCNYFGKPYVDFFSERRLTDFSWQEIERLSNGGVLAYLTAQPDQELLRTDELEIVAKQYLGEVTLADVV
ncbi:MAG: hypothetical protein ACI35R_05905 [Bacillus sp. (in: firmicutes)]